MFHAPGSIIADAQLPLQFQRRDAVLWLRQEIHPKEPSRQRQFGVLENRAAGHRGLMMTTVTLIQTTCGYFTVADVPALRAHEPAGPSPLKQGTVALFIGAILVEELGLSGFPRDFLLILLSGYSTR